MTSVLLIDDDNELSKLLEEYLQSEQFELAADLRDRIRVME